MEIKTILLMMSLLGLSAVMISIYIDKTVIANLGARLDSFATRASTQAKAAPTDLEAPFSERVLKPMMRTLITTIGSRSSAAKNDRLRMKLQRAGNPGKLGPGEFVGLKFLLALGFPLMIMGITTVVGIAPNTAFMIAAFIGVIGFIAPERWLDKRAKARKTEITKSLPDAIDLLTISVESGLGFDPAMMRVADKWDNALAHEFSRCLSDIRVGKPKRESLREMAERVDEDGLNTFVSAVIQADALGVPITQILRVQAATLRERRREQAEIKAQKAPLKMLFPMILLIFPALYIIILGPALPQVFNMM